MDKNTTPVELQKCISPTTAGMLEICEKLFRLEENWLTIFSGSLSVFGRETAPGGCRIEKEGIVLTVNVKEASKITSLKFKEKQFRETISGFLGIKAVRIEFVSGRVQRIPQSQNNRQRVR